MRARLRLAPGQRVEPEADRGAEQFVPGGMEVHLVDPVAEPVVGAQLRRVLVRLRSPADGPRRAGEGADLARPFLGPVPTLAPQRLDQDPVGLEGVVVLQRGGLVDDLVGRGARAFGGRHAGDCLRARPRRRRALDQLDLGDREQDEAVTALAAQPVDIVERVDDHLELLEAVAP